MMHIGDALGRCTVKIVFTTDVRLLHYSAILRASLVAHPSTHPACVYESRPWSMLSRVPMLLSIRRQPCMHHVQAMELAVPGTYIAGEPLVTIAAFAPQLQVMQIGEHCCRNS